MRSLLDKLHAPKFALFGLNAQAPAIGIQWRMQGGPFTLWTKFDPALRIAEKDKPPFHNRGRHQE
jgi:hypothetical protein